MTDPARRKILLVEDDPVDLKLVSRALAHVAPDVEIISTLDSTEAADMIEVESPDLICTDLRMPMLDGATLVANLRATHEHDGRIVVILSTSDQPNDIRTAYANRANAYYVKPSLPSGYRDMARQLIEHWFSVAQICPESSIERH